MASSLPEFVAKSRKIAGILRSRLARDMAPAVPQVVPAGGASVFLEGGTTQVVTAFSWKFSWKAVQRLPRSPASEQVAREVDDQNGPIVVVRLAVQQRWCRRVGASIRHRVTAAPPNAATALWAARRPLHRVPCQA
jgi:hypothetical protein